MSQQNRLSKFIIASIAVHLLIVPFVVSHNNEKQISISIPDDYQPLQIAINAKPKQEPAKELTQAKPEPVNSARNKTSEPKIISALEVKIADNSSIPEKQTQDQLTKTDAPTRTTTTSESENKTREQETEPASFAARSAVIKNKLDAIIKENFRYPRFAVRRGWQGTVELGLRIEANGKLSRLRVVKTSGYQILDQAALTTLAKTSYINDIESWLAGDTFDTILPVKYKLIDG